MRTTQVDFKVYRDGEEALYRPPYSNEGTGEGEVVFEASFDDEESDQPVDEKVIEELLIDLGYKVGPSAEDDEDEELMKLMLLRARVEQIRRERPHLESSHRKQAAILGDLKAIATE